MDDIEYANTLNNYAEIKRENEGLKFFFLKLKYCNISHNRKGEECGN